MRWRTICFFTYHVLPPVYFTTSNAMQINRSTTYKALSLPFSLIFVAGIILMTYYTPKLQEDLEFCVSNWRYVEGMTHDINWSGMWNDVIFHYTHTNGRLGDRMVIPIMTLVPQWLFAIINGGVALLLAIGVSKNSKLALPQNVSINHLMPIAITLLLVWFPWNEEVFIESYALNYLWTACLATWMAYAVMHPTFAVNKHPLALAFLAIAFLVIGTWHECVFLTLGISLIAVLSLASDSKQRKKRFILLAALLLGLLANLLTGGLRHRVTTTEILFDFHRWYNTWHRIPIPTWPVMGVIIYLFSLFTAILSSRTKLTFRQLYYSLRNKPKAMLHCVCALTGIANVFLYAFFGSPRTLLIGDTFAVIGLTALACNISGKSLRRTTTAAIYAIGLLLLTNLYVTAAFQSKINDSFLKLKQEWLSSENGNLFADIPPMNLTSPYPWHMIIGDMYISGWKHYYLSEYMRPDDPPKNFYILPAELKDIDASALKAVPGSTMPGLYSYGRHLIFIPTADSAIEKIEHTPYKFGVAAMSALTSLNHHETLYFYITPFTPNSGPEACFYLHPLVFDFNFNRTVISIDSISNFKLPAPTHK